MKIKICGLNNAENLSELILLKPDFAGFIFYPPSERCFFKGDITEQLIREMPESIKKVGVFVNADSDKVKEIVGRFGLDFVQLHGLETPDYCRQLAAENIRIIKAFRVDENFNFSFTQSYFPYTDFFLFDARGKLPGGNGIKFSWQKLENYNLSLPFFLSGGISPADAEAVKNFEYEKMYAVDINSGFEVNPGKKDIAKITEFMNQLKQ